MTASNGFSQPVRLESPSGLSVQINANGAIRRMDYLGRIINLFPGNDMEGGPANLFLRKRDGTGATRFTPLLGPDSPSGFQMSEDGFAASGEWEGVRFLATLTLSDADAAWFWQIELENRGPDIITVDLIYAQDVALAPYGAIRMNEYYVSQYLDHKPLNHPEYGMMLAIRQNQATDGQNPWCLIGSLGRGVSYATDALQVHGLTARWGGAPVGMVNGLPNRRRQHEHAMAAIQDEPLQLATGDTVQRGFFGYLQAHHARASSIADMALAVRAAALAKAAPVIRLQAPPVRPLPSLFVQAPMLEVLDFDDAAITHQFGVERRDEERENGTLLSFFVGHRGHVVLKQKEMRVLRPHGHILRTGSGWVPDEAGLTSTAWMGGVFHSMVTQGHVSINRFLSTTRSYLGLFRSHGQRVFVETAAGWRLLGIPSAFVMQPESCRWLYRHESGLIEIRSEAASASHTLTLNIAVLEGAPARFLVSHHVAWTGDDGLESGPVSMTSEAQGVWLHPAPDSELGRRFPGGGFRIRAGEGETLEQIGGDELLYADGLSRAQPFVCMRTRPLHTATFSLTGHLVEAATGPFVTAEAYWREVTAGLTVSAMAPMPVRRFAEILPWFAHNALIHYLAPRGLEQYSGGGWGTRDVTQGPVEMLLALGRFDPVRDLLLRVFANQNPDGDWPQWFMFFERERSIRPGDSHGDIVFWPLLALGQYLRATGDAALLEVTVPFFHSDPLQAESATLFGHVERALALIETRVIAGTHLAAYGHGDWNDSLQPLDPAMREHLCSAWTVTLHYQVLCTLAEALRPLGKHEIAETFLARATVVLHDFRKYLFVEGVIAGYAYFDVDGSVDYLLHPQDERTGLSYSLLPMMHAVINDMLEPEEAGAQLALIREHLHGPEGAHLFDRPMAYHGGLQQYFQRAESSSFFGREIGNMYTHAHLRYAEALWRHGDAELFYQALSQAVPIGLHEQIAVSMRRQANCYYSSSDASFDDRYQAHTEYARALAGEIPLEGGWRVYSSGAGIALSLILRSLLGLRTGHDTLVIDPVMPQALDGLRVELDLVGHRFDITYRIGPHGYGPQSLTLNRTRLPFERQENPYRTGGVVVSMALLREALVQDLNEFTIELG